ncbi:MAG: hypothetical protein AAF662_14420 [Pseudomonadota bacterium]
MRDILDARNSARPYDYGELGLDYQPRGGAYKDGFVYLVDLEGDKIQNRFEPVPTLHKYEVR